MVAITVRDTSISYRVHITCLATGSNHLGGKLIANQQLTYM